MKISLNWLKQYIGDDSITTDDVMNALITAGLEVDEMIDQNKLYDNFVVGFVKDKKKHPNADKLSLCVVNDGEKDVSVVCGAPNVGKGQKIALAKVGAVIPEGGFEIKPVKLRGENSEGMICSERELGISDNHDGIMVLDGSLIEGTPLSKAINRDDVIFDIDITPNRADALSHIGVARDVCAVLKKELKYPVIEFEEEDKKSSDYASVVIENETDCPRYVGKVITGVTIKESPGWLKNRLTSIGLRPINNVVDVTNFVLHEMGQPLHAFDLDMLAGKKIVVKSAADNEKFVTLDSKERTLGKDNLMICDAEKSVAVAGVMGGENSEVTNDTRNILIESAYFRPSSVRKTAKMLGLSTDSSYRFERGCNPERVIEAARRAAQLIAGTGDGKIAAGEIDAYPNKLVRKTVKLRYDRVIKILGYEISPEDISEIISRLEFPIVFQDEKSLICEIPLFRPDIEREIDLIEEVARIKGFDKIPTVGKVNITLDPKIDQLAFSQGIRESLISLGMREIVTNSLLNKETAEKFGHPITILNPQNQEMSNLRPSLLPGMLATISKNLKVRETDLRYFEVGHVFEKKSENDINSFNDFTESEELLYALTGKSGTDEWYRKSRGYDIYDLIGLTQDFMTKNSLDKDNRYNYNHGNSFYDQSFKLFVKDLKIGTGGKLNRNLLDDYDIKQEVFCVSLNLGVLKSVEKEEKKFTELLKFPKVIRDFAVILDKKIHASDVIEIITKNCSNLLKNVKLFDIFESESLGEGKKSLAFELEFYNIERTLTEEEVNKDFWKAIEEVKKKFNAQLRG
ncbi:MAG: phenylalanine--tRNA ligase subunit beta [Melioribacteraceae bacterium]|nr:phenylalanine--tRNA ligase subunit beta [Melioribacteraceae bacterium]